MKPVPEQIKEIRGLVNGYKSSRVLMAAEELGVFAALAEQTRALEDVARSVGTPVERLRALLDVMVGVGVLTKDDGRYSIANEFSTLNPEHPAAQNGYIRYAREVSQRWESLAAAVRSNEPAQRNFEAITGADKKTAKAFADAMNANAKTQAAFLAREFEFAGHAILDVGAGAGTYSIEVGRHSDDARAVLLEVPEMVPITKEFVNSAGLSSRLEVIGGDYRKRLPTGEFDDIFLFAVLHQEGETEARELLSRCKRVLRQGGRLFLTSFFVDDSRTGPPFAAMFGVEMLVMVPTGRVYSLTEAKELVKDAGFADVAVRGDIPGPATLIVAR